MPVPIPQHTHAVRCICASHACQQLACFAVCPCAVYDVTRADSFENLERIWMKEVDIYSNIEDAVKMVVANKVDLVSKTRVLMPCTVAAHAQDRPLRAAMAPHNTCIQGSIVEPQTEHHALPCCSCWIAFGLCRILSGRSAPAKGMTLRGAWAACMWRRLQRQTWQVGIVKTMLEPWTPTGKARLGVAGQGQQYYHQQQHCNSTTGCCAGPATLHSSSMKVTTKPCRFWLPRQLVETLTSSSL